MTALTQGDGSTFSSSWLLPASPTPVKILSGEDLVDHTFAMPMDSGVGTITRMALPGGLIMSRACSLLHRLQPGRVLRAASVDIEFEADTLFIQHLRSGTNSLYEAVSGKAIDYCRGQLHMRLQRRLELINGFHCDEQIDLYSLSVPMPYLSMLLGSSSAQKVVKGLGLRLGEPPCARVVDVGPDMVWPLYRAFDTALEGDMLRVHLLAKGVEFLSLLCQSALSPKADKSSAPGTPAAGSQPAVRSVTSEGGGDRNPKGVSLKCLEAVKRAATAQQWSETELQAVAVKYGVSVRALLRSFSAHYGTTLAAYRKRHRLQAARHLLRESALPIKAIAHDTGYSNVSNFSNAYKQEFGESPGKTRELFSAQNGCF